MSQGPTVLWGELKGKKVKSNDGENLGQISKISQNYIRLEKGSVKKDKYWVPKYYADSYDGKILWLSEGEEEVRSKFRYGKEPSPDQFQQDADSFKASHDKSQDWDVKSVEVTKGVPSKPKETRTGYKNVRDLK
jgi:hypothetical protein